MSILYQEVVNLLGEIEQVEEKIKAEKKRKQAIANQVVRKTRELSEEDRYIALERIASLFSADELTEKFTRVLSQEKIPLTNVASFQELLVQATRRRQLYNFQPEWKLNNKHVAYQFVDRLGVRRAKTFASNYSLDSIQPRAGTVLKPENGSSSYGVFIFDEQGGAFEVRTGDTLESVSDALDKASSMMTQGIIKKDVWLLEEFIGDFEEGKPLAPIDLKFYCFFGEVGFVLEVERGNETRYCEWLPDGSLADTGRYNNRGFVGNGFAEEHLEIAKNISKFIAAPFIRIDFIKSKNDFSFCEFTPRPGQFSSFNKTFDRYLGECYLSAEGRLMKHWMR